jgi:hypothetical protein
MTFDEHCAYLREKLFPTEERDGPLGDVPVDASFLRDLLARYGSCRLWNASLRRKLRPFADAYTDLLGEASEAESVGHAYDLDDYSYASVHVGHLRQAHELLEANAAQAPPAEEEDPQS